MTTLPDISEYMPTKEGFPRPDWNAISARIERSLPEPEWQRAWESASLQWVSRLCRELGGQYRLHETPSFLVVTEAPDPIIRDACSSFEAALKQILRSLDGVASDAGHGKRVILMFGRLEEYYRYITYFYPEGEHPMSEGVCLSGEGYVHFAFPTPDYSCHRSVLVHELTHGCVAHLPIPTWLNEALAMRMEEVVSGSGTVIFGGELYDRHLAHWNVDSIQTFWTGESWDIPGDSSELSYSLAQILWRMMEVDMGASRSQVMRFIAAAQASDAAESACQSIFGRSLGDLVRGFLGDGNWKPNPGRWPSKPGTPNPAIAPRFQGGSNGRETPVL